jgi:hypothetical protein
MTGVKSPVRMSSDLRRVLALPRRPRPEGAAAERIIEAVTTRLGVRNPSCECASQGRQCITRLNAAQAWALWEIYQVGGLLGIIQVGAGKTILDLLAPLAMKDCATAVLLVPASLVGQLVREYRLVRQHFRVPEIIVHGLDWRTEVPNAPTLHVLSYQRLSRPDATEFFEELRPDLIIADECHMLRHARATRTARLLRYFANNGETRFCGWTGSITDSSLRDYGHLSALALRFGSPMPLDPKELDAWAGALDPSEWQAPAGALRALCDGDEHVAVGYHRRLVETRGVVSTTGSVIEAEIRIDERPAPPIPPVLATMLNAVRATWVRPDGEELVDALSLSRCLRELAQGIYLRWIFPRGEPREVIDEWFAARKAWGQEMREKLKSAEPHLDSPMLCARAAARAWGDVANPDPSLPRWRAESWPRWRNARPTVEPESQAVRVDDYLARDAATWADSERGIVWYSLVEFGKWVSEISGLPLHGGGAKADERIAAERGDRSIVASIKSHGTGRDGLQHLFCHQLIASPPSSSAEWQQCLGRLYRLGQRASVVHALYFAHTPELAANVEEALCRSRYVRDTIGEEQKLLRGMA